MLGTKKGIREPDVFKIKKIIELLEIDADYLLDIKKSSPNDEEPLDEDEGALMLYKALISAGFLKEREDLTPQQFEFLDGLTSYVERVFR